MKTYPFLYVVSADRQNGNTIDWTTYIGHTAFRWFREMMASKRTIDTDQPIIRVALRRNDRIVYDIDLIDPNAEHKV